MAYTTRETALVAPIRQKFKQGWLPVADLFRAGQGRRTLYGVANDLIKSNESGNPRPVVVVDVSEQGNPRVWVEEIERRVLMRLLQVLISQSAQISRRSQDSNVLVMIDEAARPALRAGREKMIGT